MCAKMLHDIKQITIYEKSTFENHEHADATRECTKQTIWKNNIQRKNDLTLNRDENKANTHKKPQNVRQIEKEYQRKYAIMWKCHVHACKPP